MTDNRDKQSRVPVAGTGPSGSEEKIFWQADNIRVVRADTTDVTGTREEIAITFGTTRSRDGSQADVIVDLYNRILLSPYTAKRLAIILGHTMEQYEDASGAIQTATVAVAGSSPSLPSTGPAIRPAGALRSERLFLLVKGLGAPFGFERSFKVSERTLLANRFLLSVARDSIGGDGMARVLDLCREADIPVSLLPLVERYFPTAEILHFGFEEGENGSIYKIYFEFPGKRRTDPFLVHLACKWDPADPSRYAVARYTRFPFIPLNDIIDRVSVILGDTRHVAALRTATAILGMTPFKAIDDMHYLEVEEEGNPRKSFDINVYKARLPLAELAPVLIDLTRRYSIPQDAFQGLMADISSKVFGHLSGGIDRSGREFFTIHYGVEAC